MGKVTWTVSSFFLPLSNSSISKELSPASLVNVTYWRDEKLIIFPSISFHFNMESCASSLSTSHTSSVRLSSPLPRYACPLSATFTSEIPIIITTYSHLMAIIGWRWPRRKMPDKTDERFRLADCWSEWLTPVLQYIANSPVFVLSSAQKPLTFPS